MRKNTLYIAGTILAIFGLLTLFLSGSVIFDLFGMRAKQGNNVSIVIWANFLSSFLYICSAYGFFKQKKWVQYF